MIDADRDEAAARLWTFSMAVYGEPGVEAACLDLQDRCGLDVNLLLYACWVAVHGVVLERRHIEALGDFARPWRQAAIEPLRRIRRRLKLDPLGMPAPEVEAFRQRVKAAELEAERLLLAAWARRATLGGGVPDIEAESLARRNLEACFAAAERLPDGRDGLAIAAILAGCCGFGWGKAAG
jgi:uncharacterized protein (TIGR02444 family)